MKEMGKPYRWGATGPNSFDCSGLMLYVYRQLGIEIPRVSRHQYWAGMHVNRSQLLPGDLVFFSYNGAPIATTPPYQITEDITPFIDSADAIIGMERIAIAKRILIIDLMFCLL